MFSEKEIQYLSTLVKLKLTESEIKILSKALSSSTSYLDMLNELDTSNVDATYQVSKQSNVFQTDNLTGTKTLTQEEVLLNASEHEDSYVKTKGVLNQE